MKIKVKALCVFLHEEKILVEQRSRDGQTFCRPIGGRINFGEHSADAIVREVKEELGADITLPEFFGVLEAIEDGKHEILFIYNAKFLDPGFYRRDAEITEADGEKKSVVWKPLSVFISREERLYPEGLLQLLMK